MLNPRERIHPSIHPSIDLFIDLSIYLYFYLSLYIYIDLFIWLFIYLKGRISPPWNYSRIFQEVNHSIQQEILRNYENVRNRGRKVLIEWKSRRKTLTLSRTHPKCEGPANRNLGKIF